MSFWEHKYSQMVNNDKNYNGVITDSNLRDTLLELFAGKIVESLPKGCEVLNIGAGKGAGVRELHALGFKVSCLDIAKSLLDRISDVSKTYLVSQIHEMPSHTFKFIMSHLVCQHMTDEQLHRQMKHCIRCLAEDGIFAIQFATKPLSGWPYAEDIDDSQITIEQINTGSVLRSFKRMETIVNAAGGKIVFQSGPVSYWDLNLFAFHWNILHIHGIVSGESGRNGQGPPINLEHCARLMYKNLFPQDTDVFVHSWSVNHQDPILSLYKPKKYLFEPQDTFGMALTDSPDESHTHAFRTVSRYTSLKKAMDMKSAYEIENRFRYKWVIALRFDLVFLTKVQFDNLDPACFYVCYEPWWPDILAKQMVHDIVFLASSDVMDRYLTVYDEITQCRHNDILDKTHIITWRKLMSMYNNLNGVKYFVKRYDDVEIYRFVIHPEQNIYGEQYGHTKLKERMEEQLSQC